MSISLASSWYCLSGQRNTGKTRTTHPEERRASAFRVGSTRYLDANSEAAVSNVISYHDQFRPGYRPVPFWMHDEVQAGVGRDDV